MGCVRGRGRRPASGGRGADSGTVFDCYFIDSLQRFIHKRWRALLFVFHGPGVRLLLIRPCEVLSRVANVTILEVANNALRVLLQHRHVIIGSLA